MKKRDLYHGLVDVLVNPTLKDELDRDIKALLDGKPEDATEEELFLMGAGYGFALATR